MVSKYSEPQQTSFHIKTENSIMFFIYDIYLNMFMLKAKCPLRIRRWTLLQCLVFNETSITFDFKLM